MSMTRRQFARIGISTATGSWLLGARGWAGDKTYGDFNMGIQSYSLRNFPFERAINIVKELELHYLETYNDHIPMSSTAEKIEDVKKMLDERDIKVMSYGVVGFDGNAGKNREMFEFAKAMGLFSISADPSPEAFESLDKLVEEYRIRIAIHPHGPGARYPGWKSVQQAIEGKHRRIGICMDIGHTTRAGDDAIEGILALKNRVYGVHLKDVNDKNEDVSIGSGRLNIPGIFKALKEVGFRGIVALEYEPTPEDPMPGIRQSLQYLKKILA